MSEAGGTFAAQFGTLVTDAMSPLGSSMILVTTMTCEARRPTEVPVILGRDGRSHHGLRRARQRRQDSGERIEGVSHLLPYSDLLALTSSHVCLLVTD